MEDGLQKFIEGMPKIELHLHIEGSLEPELAFKLAKNNNVTLCKKDGTPYKDAAEFKDATHKFGDLQEFLDLYYEGMKALKTEQDFYKLTKAYLEKIASQNVTHAEIFFDPQQHLANGISFGTVVHGITKALKEARETGIGSEKKHITTQLHMHFLRHLDEESAFHALAEAQKIDLSTNRPYLDQIDGFGLDSGEAGNPPSKFKNLYMALGKIIDAKTGEPKALMMHAGEEGPADYVRQALEIMKEAWDQKGDPKKRRIRIDHGNHALDDKAVVDELAAEGTGMTVCPLSNLKLKHKLVFKTDITKEVRMTDLKDHRLRDMLALGLKASIHSDDPAYFGGYMNENYIAIAEALNLTRDDIIQLARNAIETSFLSPQQKAQKENELNRYVEKAALADKYVNPNPGPQRVF